MGLYVKGANGAFSGKVGSVVGANWRSIDYLRSLPRPSKRKATEKQQAQRAKFAMVMEFLNPLRDLINIFYSDKNERKNTGFNKAFHKLLNEVDGDYPDFTIPYDKVRFSKPGITNIYPTVNIDPEGGIIFKWTNPVGIADALDTDIVHFILFHPLKKDFFVFQGGLREAGEFTVGSEGMPEGEYHIWVMLINENNSKCSSSDYIGTIDI